MEFKTFIDVKLLVAGCDLGKSLSFLGFNGVQPLARHFY
jgi:hypothetical protein